ncbi:polysaccharide deacetylase family protein [Chitinophaga arvensicola]|nr:polysaccharide deacetylase family protein [Chitinophaga arvensicola]
MIPVQPFIIRLLLVLTIPIQLSAQEKWPGGKKAAIVLTYDDGLVSQLNTAIPQLRQSTLTGTFFLTGNVTEDQMLSWRAAAADGFELANHTLYHPCSKKMYENAPQYYTENYDVNAMLKEAGMMNKILFGIDGKRSRTYAFPCSESVVGGVDYTPALKQSGLVKYARSGGDIHSIITDFSTLDLYKIPSWGVVNKEDGKALISFVEAATAKGGLGIFMFHGVGGDYLDVSGAAHEQLLQYLASHRKDIWVATFQEVMDYVTAQQKQQR